MIDLSLDSFLIPDLIGYTLPFGTKITRTAENKGGLSTREVSNNVAMSFLRERSVVVSESDSTSIVEYDAKLVISASSAITLTLAAAQYAGCKLTIINNTTLTHTLSCTSVSTNTPHILPNAIFNIMWNGSAWQAVGSKNVGETYYQEPQQESPFDVFPCSDWVEIISHNGAFKRAANAPTSLYSLDGSKFYRDSELTNPVDFSGLLVNGSAATATDSGNTVTNSKGQIVHIYTGNWTTGAASDYIEKTGVLVAQKDCIRTHSITVTGGNHNHAIGAEWSADGNVFPRGYYTTGASRSSGWSGNLTLTGTYGNATSNPETRSVNYTIRIWKRIS